MKVLGLLELGHFFLTWNFFNGELWLGIPYQAGQNLLKTILGSEFLPTKYILLHPFSQVSGIAIGILFLGTPILSPFILPKSYYRLNSVPKDDT